MSEPVRAVLVGGRDGAAEGIANALALPVLRLRAASLLAAGSALDGCRCEHEVVWIHLVPSATVAECKLDPFSEAALLCRSAHAAHASARAAGVSLTFLAVLPSPGVFGGAAGTACDLALSAASSLMRDEVGRWSAPDRRMIGVVHAGIDGHEPPGQRPCEELRLRTPMGSLGSFEQVADALRFLGSRRATYITATLLRVDGGWAAYSWVYPTRSI